MRQKLIYILGAGRSGTTILDIVLGNCSNGISLGEINRFFKRKGIAPKRDPGTNVHEFWQSIKKTFDDKTEEEYDVLKKVFDKYEYHTGFSKAFFCRTDKRYQNALSKQYESIAEHTQNKTVIIESSKYPARAINISTIIDEKFDIGYVYLKKDPVKVVSSFGKKGLEQPAKSFLASNLYYLLVNILCYLAVWKLRKRGHKVTLVKYEDLISRTARTLDTISEQHGIDLGDTKTKIENGYALDTGYLFDGNRIRLKENIVLQKELKKVKQKGLSYYFTRGINYLIYH